MKTTIKTLSVGLFILIGFILFNALTHNPVQTQDIDRVNISIDTDRAVSNLSESIKFKTISNQQAFNKNQQEYDLFIAWLKTTYELVFQKTSLQTFNETLLFKWEGKDKSLQPILLTGHYDVVPVIPGTEERWKEPPFSGKVDSEFIWGRGALDDKSGVIGILEAVTYLLEKDFQPTRT